MANQTKATREIKYDVERAAFLLRWVGLHAVQPEFSEYDVFKAVKRFLDDLCPTCHGRGDYIDSRGDREPCDDCGQWTRESVITYVIPSLEREAVTVEDF